MTKDDFSALCAMSKALGYKTFWELQGTARVFGVKTNAELLELVETLWEFQRAAATDLYSIRSDES